MNIKYNNLLTKYILLILIIFILQFHHTNCFVDPISIGIYSGATALFSIASKLVYDTYKCNYKECCPTDMSKVNFERTFLLLLYLI